MYSNLLNVKMKVLNKDTWRFWFPLKCKLLISYNGNLNILSQWVNIEYWDQMFKHNNNNTLTLMWMFVQEWWEGYWLTQGSPQEFLTIQYSTPFSSTPQPATDTIWLIWVENTRNIYKIVESFKSILRQYEFIVIMHWNSGGSRQGHIRHTPPPPKKMDRLFLSRFVSEWFKIRLR